MNDGQLKQAFMQAQEKLIDATRQLSTVKQQMNQKEKEKKISTLTNNELAALSNDTPTYKSVGKMFLQTDIDVLRGELSGIIEGCERDTKNLEKAAQKIERDINDREKALKEVLQRN